LLSLATVATALYISLGPGLGDCVTNEVIAHDMNNSAIPEELKVWASGDNHGEVNNYVHLADGNMFFSGQDADNGFISCLTMAMTNGTFTVFSDVRIRSGFFAIGLDDEHNFPSGMCLTYAPWYGFPHGYDENPNVRLLCYNSSDNMFRKTMLPYPGTKSRDSYSQGDYSVRWLNHLVWLRATFHDYRSGDVRRTGIYNMDYENMTWTNVVEPEPYRPSNECRNHLHWLDIGVGTLALIFSSFWLLEIRRIPSGMVPLIFFVTTLLSSISWHLGFFSGIVGAIAAAASLVGRSLRARMNREEKWSCGHSTRFLLV
jgi:hypothetical protein